MIPSSRFLPLGLLGALSFAACSSNDSVPQDDGDDNSVNGSAGSASQDDDESGSSSGSGTCQSDVDCRDGVFCNGDEACDPTSPSADDRGCRPGRPPCTAGMCNEKELICEDTCPDLDGDGHTNVLCGGDDCDDNDSDRFPGNTERCDDIDQDCDEGTLGDKDEDKDGSVSSECCNGTRCGDDCDDTQANISRLAPEVCDGFDNDCDGAIDEGVSHPAYADNDLDGFGEYSETPEFLCILPIRTTDRLGDCNDDVFAINPLQRDVCDGIDNNCDGNVDEGADDLCPGESVCVAHPGGGASCRVLDCPQSHADCDKDPSNGCEANLCTDEGRCGNCDNTCNFVSECITGGCDSPGDMLTSAPYINDIDDPRIGATLHPLNTCSLSSPVLLKWGDNSEYEYGDSNPLLQRLDKPDHHPTYGGDVVFSRTEIASLVSGIEEPTIGERYALAIINYKMASPQMPDFELRITGTTGTPVVVERHQDNAGNGKIVIPGIVPGTVTIEPNDIPDGDPGCDYECIGEPSITQYLEGDSVLTIDLGTCGVECIFNEPPM